MGVLSGSRRGARVTEKYIIMYSSFSSSRFRLHLSILDPYIPLEDHQNMDVILERTETLIATMLDVSSKALLRLSNCLHKHQHQYRKCFSRPDPDYNKTAAVSGESHPKQMAVKYPQRTKKKHTSSTTPVQSLDKAERHCPLELQQERGSLRHERTVFSRAAVQLSKLNEAPGGHVDVTTANVSTTSNKSDSPAPKKEHEHKYPPELKMAYRQAKEQAVLRKEAKKAKAADKLKVKAGTPAGPCPVTPVPAISKGLPLQKAAKVTGGPGTPKMRPAKIENSVHRNTKHTSTPVQALGCEKDLSVASPNTPGVASKPPPSPYQESIDVLEKCRTKVDTCLPEYKSAKACVVKAQATLQCLLRQGEYPTGFWFKQKESAEKIMKKAMKAVNGARVSEKQAIFVVSGGPVER